MSLEKVTDRKFSLQPVELKPNQIHCEVCGGTGWMLRDDKWLETCHNPGCNHGAISCCPNCGKPYQFSYRSHCGNPECEKKIMDELDKQEKENERLRFEKAEKLSDDGFERFHMLFSDYYNGNEGYFTEWWDFFAAWEDLTYCNDGVELARPEYVWSTSCTQMSMEADSIVEMATDDLWEGARDNISEADLRELQDFLDAWCKKQSGTETYDVDYRYAVKIPWEMYDND